MSSSDGPDKSSQLYAKFLGPVRFEYAGEPLYLPGSQLPALLGLLIMQSDRPVSLDAIIEHLWHGQPPKNSIRMAQNLVSRLKSILSDAGHPGLTVVKRAVTLTQASSDVTEFEKFVAEARSACASDRHASGAEAFASALGLVSGPPLIDLEGALFAPEAARLDQLLDQVESERLEALLQADKIDLAIEQSLLAIARSPLSERATKVLMEAYYLRGETQKALEAFERTRDRLGEDLGMDPSSELQAIHRSILRGSSLRSKPSSAAGSTAHGTSIPHETPAGPAAFLGRDQELAELKRQLFEANENGRTGIVNINGAGGIGKSALATSLGNEIADEYPDGQLYVNLHGATPGLTPLEPRVALKRFLRSLGSDTIAHKDPEELSGHFRTVARPRSLLLILDNARDASQIRLLLPNGPKIAVIVTSRQPISSIDDAYCLQLGVLDSGSSVSLLESSINSTSTQRNREVHELARFCGGHPLALCVISARIKAQSPDGIQTVLESLQKSRTKLPEFADNERSILASLDLSIAELKRSRNGQHAVELFKAMGLWVGNELSLDAGAASMGLPVEETEALFKRLEEFRLVDRLPSGRFQMHDIIRLYSIHLSTDLPLDYQREIIARTRNFYLYSCRQVLIMYDAALELRVKLSNGVPENHRVVFSTIEEAFAWIDVELTNLVELARSALNPPHSDHQFIGILSSSFFPVSLRISHRPEILDLLELSDSVIEDLDGDLSVYTLCDLGRQYILTSNYEKASHTLERAEKAVTRERMWNRLIWVLAEHARLKSKQGDFHAALADFSRSRELAVQHDHHEYIIWTDMYSAGVYEQLGDSNRAIALCERAIRHAKSNGLERTQIYDFASISVNYGARLMNGNQTLKAIEVISSSMKFIEYHSFTESNIYVEHLWRLADAYYSQGSAQEARTFWTDAADIALKIETISEKQHRQILNSTPPVLKLDDLHLGHRH
ncbi:BTAD domain-containing putative transcriptional regulator [Salininema proteolyticum]|uniref:BTAD domain-containing putative transcriptional regulator n=1 Tax=Salininema proteolyticum TaxID=1607685 RepID=A0ABV8TWR8_9ACTN